MRQLLNLAVTVASFAPMRWLRKPDPTRCSRVPGSVERVGGTNIYPGRWTPAIYSASGAPASGVETRLTIVNLDTLELVGEIGGVGGNGTRSTRSPAMGSPAAGRSDVDTKT